MILNVAERWVAIDGSGLRAFSECPMRAWFSHVAGASERGTGGYVSRYSNPAFAAGSAVHKALETRYREARHGPVPSEVRDRMFAAVDEIYQAAEFSPEYEARTPEWRTADRCKDLLAAYLDHYPEEPFVVRECEAPFSRRLGEVTVGGRPWRVQWQGRRDLVVAYKVTDGREWVMDHKTTSSAESNPIRAWTRSRSMLGYVWSRGELTGRTPEGFIMNVLTWRKPTKRPAPELAVKVTLDDGFEVMPTPKRTLPRNEFSRTPVPVQGWMLDEWRHGVLADVQRIIEARTSGVWPATGTDCAFCRYFDICTTRPADRERMLVRGDFVPNTWSPLNQET